MDRKAGPIVVKRKKVVAGGHHGGAWKVAYADFVTAMMAFFLLMWLLSVTDEETRLGLADYFSPTIPIHSTRGGGDGPFDGESMFSQDVLAKDETGQKGDPEEKTEPGGDRRQPLRGREGAARRQRRRDGGRPAARAHPHPGDRRGADHRGLRHPRLAAVRRAEPEPEPDLRAAGRDDRPGAGADHQPGGGGRPPRRRRRRLRRPRPLGGCRPTGRS